MRLLAMMDDAGRPCLAIEMDTASGGHRVVAVLERQVEAGGTPKMLITDSGAGLVGRALDAWAHAHGIQLHFTGPGKRNQNTCIESFNGRFRDECLSDHRLLTLAHTRQAIEAWRVDYNGVRPRSSSGNPVPMEFEPCALERAPKPILTP